MLSESYRRRIKQLSGVLLEKDERKTIVDVLKLPQKVADWAHGINDKLSLWIANTFKNDLYAEFPAFKEIDLDKDYTDPLNRSKKKMLLQILDRWMDNRRDEYGYIMDWLRGRNEIAIETDKIILKDLTFKQALDRSKRWHDEVAKIRGGQIQGETGEVIKVFPDGFYWINLQTSYCSKESAAMGHCGNVVESRNVLYSLRKERYPYITVELNHRTGKIRQIKGRANTRPKSDFHPYIVWFILDKNLGVTGIDSIFRPETDFHVEDLSNSLLNKVIQEKPGMVFHFDNKEEFYKKMPFDLIQKVWVDSPERVDIQKVGKGLGWNKAEELINHKFDGFGNYLVSLYNTEEIEDILSNVKLTEEQVEELSHYVSLKMLIKFYPEYIQNFDLGSSLYLKLKQSGKDELVGQGGKNIQFENDGVRFMFKDWEDLSDDLFDNESAERVETIFNGDIWSYLDNSYIMGTNLSSLYLPDINNQAYNAIKQKMVEAMNQEGEVGDEVREEINALNDGKSLMSWLENNEGEYDWLEDVCDNLKRAIARAQDSADGDEYWNLAMKPILDFFGSESSWTNVDLGDGKSVQKLSFLMPYDRFMNLLSAAESGYDQEENEKYLFTDVDDLDRNISYLFSYAFESGEEDRLEFNEPYNGVYGDLDGDVLSDSILEEM